MHGNAWEWVRDGYATALPGGSDPSIDASGLLRVFRGGGWVCLAYDCDAAMRRAQRPDCRYRYLGFHVALCQTGR